MDAKETALDRLQRFYDLGGRIFLQGDEVLFQVGSDSPEARCLADEIRSDSINLNQTLYFYQTFIRLATLGTSPCHICGSRLAWRSIYGPVICGSCHPPQDTRLVASVLYVGPVEWKM